MHRIYEYALFGAIGVVAVISVVGLISGAEPEPIAQAELIRPEQIEIPRIRYICSQTGEEAMAYSGSEGQLIINPTGESCDYQAWLANDGPNAGW